MENVRLALQISTQKARTYCEMAVANDLFVRRIGIVCPHDNRIISDYEHEHDLPEEITCNVCRADGIEPDTFKVSDLKKVTFYTVKKNGN